MLAGCSSEEENPNFCSYPTDNTVRVTANVNNMIRATYTTASIAEFGMCICKASDDSYNYPNMKMAKNGSEWKPATEMLWQNSTQAVDIIAYAPYDANLTNANISNYELEVSTNQTQTDDKSDFLIYKRTGFVPKNDLVNGIVPVTFDHALSQLNLTITFDSKFSPMTSNPITSVKIRGTKVKGTCDFTLDQPAVTAKDGSAADVTAQVSDFTAAASSSENAVATYSCILIPQTVSKSDFSIDIEATFYGNNKTYHWFPSQAITLENGKDYQLSMTLEKDN